ncbi:hypothetical protein N0V82_007557 [Gnomoniopsis sp. IMI 355080]|nr:hypothetical protein N0V82_007557 [Gnomoniopsis sp. IMI 355080]
MKEVKAEIDLTVLDHDRSTAAESSDETIRQGKDEANIATSRHSAPNTAISKARAIALVATVTGASFLNTLSGQALVIILPSIGNELSIPSSRQQWIISAYSLAFGCFLLVWGRIADLYGKRLIFILGSAWVSLTLVINPFVRNEAGFALFRGLQGLGAAANVPTAIGILGTTFPPGQAKNYAFSTYAAGAPLGSIFGNLLGGVIANYVHWAWVLWVLAILAALVTMAGFFVIPPPPTTLKAQGATITATVDWVGAILITVGLMLLLFALTQGNVVGWSTFWIPILIVIALLLIALFILWQHRLEKRGGQAPLMKVSIFRNRRFSAAMAIMSLFFGAFNSYLIFTTYFFQDYQGLSPIQTTLRFIPTGVVGILTALVCGKLLARVPTNYLLTFGNASNTLSCLLFALPIPPTTSYFAYGLPAMVLSVLGADTSWPGLMLFTSHSLPQADQAMGGALVNAVGQLGRALGLAVSTAVQTAVMAGARGVSVQHSGRLEVGDEPTLSGLRAAQWTNFGIGAAGLGVVLVLFRGAGIVGRSGVKSEGATDVGQESMSRDMGDAEGASTEEGSDDKAGDVKV